VNKNTANRQARCQRRHGELWRWRRAQLLRPITNDLYNDAEKAAPRKKPSLPRSAAAIRLPSRSFSPAKSYSISLWRRHRRYPLRKARRPHSKAYGLDMTDEMLALARENQKKAGIENLDSSRRHENVPLPDNSVDVIVSNCVINLSGDKDASSAKPSASSSRRPLCHLRRRCSR